MYEKKKKGGTGNGKQRAGCWGEPSPCLVDASAEDGPEEVRMEAAEPRPFGAERQGACVSRAPVTKPHNPGGLTTAHRSEGQVHDQGVGRVGSFLEFRGGVRSGPLVVCWQSLVFLGLRKRHLDFRLRLPTAFSLCVCPSPHVPLS